ncbi:MAG: cytochrome c3 family protein [Desulfuromonadales bacterium]|nr:cytochrome c3 family protein [Desulfuromonadales bacterium]
MKIKIIIPVIIATFACVAGLSPLATAAAAAPPAQVRIDQLSKDFEPVEFDHAGHVDMVGDCGECHHHTTGTSAKDPDCMRCHSSGATSERVACRDCHAPDPFSADHLKTTSEDRKRYHRDLLGLKGAYHRSCTGCHEASGGPTGCLDCHQRTEAGNALFRAGKYAPAPTDKASGH